MSWTLIGEINPNLSWQTIALFGTKEVFLFDYELGDDPDAIDPDLSLRFLYPLQPGLWGTGKTWRIYPRITSPDLRSRMFHSDLIAAGITTRELQVRMLKPRTLWGLDDSEAMSRIQFLNLRVSVLN